MQIDLYVRSMFNQDNESVEIMEMNAGQHGEPGRFSRRCWPGLSLRVLIACVLMSLVSCMSPSKKPKLLLTDHQLVGKIWDVEQQAYLDQDMLVARMLDSDYLLLGERHDNPVHHQHQSWAIKQLANKGKQASVAFEMIDNDQGARLDKKEITSAEQLIAELDLSTTGWDYEHRYKALFAEVIAAGYSIDSANLDRQHLMDIIMQGEDNLTEAYQHMLDATPLSAEQMKASQQEIIQSHCGMLDEKSGASMVLGQRLRDAVMADSLLNSQQPVKVLIAGAAHVRNDRAVPLYLRTNLKQQGKDARILSIGMIEVESSETDPSAYSAPWGSETLPFDIAWFTPQVNREDMCKQLKQHFKKKSD